MLQSSHYQILKPTYPSIVGITGGFKRREAIGYRFMGEVMRFKEVCALNIVVQSDPNEKLLVLWISLMSWINIVIIVCFN